MRILIDIAHPAHVHLFRNFYHEMLKRGHELIVTVKEIPAAKRLLELYGMEYHIIGSKSDSLAGKAVNQLFYNLRMLRLVKRYRIETGIGSSPTIAYVSSFSRMRSVMLDDDDDTAEPLVSALVHPFVDLVVSPDALRGNRKKRNTLFYPGYHELAYLHPKRFRPDESVPAEAGIAPGERYFVMRFTAFKAHHDRGAEGLSNDQKLGLVRMLEEYGRVFITSEKETGTPFAGYRITLSPDKIHSLIWYSSLFIGDSQTMSAEAAVMGVPALRCNTFAGRLSTLEELEKRYGLTYAYRPDEFDKLIAKLREMLSNPNLKEEWQQKRMKMMNDQIDVTSFLIRLTEGYRGGMKGVTELYRESMKGVTGAHRGSTQGLTGNGDLHMSSGITDHD